MIIDEKLIRKSSDKYKKQDTSCGVEYNVASDLVSKGISKGEISDVTSVATGCSILLLTWNRRYYNSGKFDFRRLEKFIENNREHLNKFRKRSILYLKDSDKDDIGKVFENLLKASRRLKSDTLKPDKDLSPVGVAKVLHLLVRRQETHCL